jgi:pyroglutamyl-peptidase
MKTVLLTGFEPFGGERLNPSWLAVRRLHGLTIHGHRIVSRRLPTAYRESLQKLRRLLRRLRPALVICVGQAGGRAEITPERVAINVDDSLLPDNAGWKPVDAAIIPGGPAAYWSTLPVKAIVRALQRHGIPASVSSTAGTFVCNHVFYGLMHELAKGGGTVRGGFVHVPFLPQQAARQAGLSEPHLRGSGLANQPTPPSVPLEVVIRALLVAVKESLRHPSRAKRPVRSAHKRRQGMASPRRSSQGVP